MTAKITLTGASSTPDWNNPPWKKITKEVYRLQVRIAEAYKSGRFGKAKALQRILTTSFYAKCLAVRRVVLNKGANTAGSDNVLWNTPRQKRMAVNSLKRHGYRTKPLKLVLIPKKNSKTGKRRLMIPCMKDRAMQSLWPYYYP